MDYEKRQIKLQEVGFPIGKSNLSNSRVLEGPMPKRIMTLTELGTLGDKCGATCIDRSFDDHVRKRLGDEDWDKLTDAADQDNATGGHSIVKPKLRMLHGRFEPIKHGFDGKDQKLGFPVQLPRGIGTEDKPEQGILNGAIKITV